MCNRITLEFAGLLDFMSRKSMFSYSIIASWDGGGGGGGRSWGL